MNDVAMGFSPAEIYAIKVEGDVVQHVTQLVADGEAIHGSSDCVLCARFRQALAVAEYVGQVEGARP